MPAAPEEKLWVKICANTNLADALFAAEAGADALGFVFAPSPRQVDAPTVRAIADQLPSGVERVGVFAGHTPKEIAGMVAAAGLTGAQLHGTPELDFILRVRDSVHSSIDLIPTIGWPVDPAATAATLDCIASHLERLARELPGTRVLIDAQLGDRSGGLGASFDWRSARHVLAHLPSLRIIVAGGLTPGNVGEAVAMLAPWGVDVASGVELRKGEKDPEKVRAFLRNARGEDGLPKPAA